MKRMFELSAAMICTGVIIGIIGVLIQQLTLIEYTGMYLITISISLTSISTVLLISVLVYELNQNRNIEV